MTNDQPETEPETLSANARISRTRAQASCDLGGEAVLLNLESGQYYGLDPVGARIWELLREPHSVQKLQATILAEYEVDSETCLRDLSTLVAGLQRAGLVEVLDGEAP
ncbi:MAG: PqqD family peptide modification chaperone [Planctomycetota bacterium]